MHDGVENPRELPVRLRIMILGNSTAIVVGRKQSRRDGTYSEVLERRLRARGIDALIVNEAKPWDLLQDALPRFMAARSPSPDVVVLNFGLGECEPSVFPRAIMRLTNEARYRPGTHPLVTRLRRFLVPRINRFRVWAMPRIMPRLGMRTWRLRPQRFESELGRLITVIRAHTAGLVVVLLPNSPSPIQERLMPGFTERADRYTQIMADVVARRGDPLVELVATNPVVEELGWRKALYDGIHYSAEAHAAVAALIEQAIDSWLASEGEPTETTAPRGRSRDRRPSAERATDAST